MGILICLFMFALLFYPFMLFAVPIIKSPNERPWDLHLYGQRQVIYTFAACRDSDSSQDFGDANKVGNKMTITLLSRSHFVCKFYICDFAFIAADDGSELFMLRIYLLVIKPQHKQMGWKEANAKYHNKRQHRDCNFPSGLHLGEEEGSKAEWRKERS